VSPSIASRRFAIGLLPVVAAAIVSLTASGAPACGLRPQPRGKPAATDSAPHFTWPVHGALLLDMCSDESERRFRGVDIAVPAGTRVKAAADGIVSYAGDDLKPFGKLVFIRHRGDWVTTYAFNSELLVARGDQVRRGQTIARSGRAPLMELAEAHFEVRHGTQQIDPLCVLPPHAASAAAGR
jgi:murein DD-endopeptidase MepM/ murein hydrolase activator NlpD